MIINTKRAEKRKKLKKIDKEQEKFKIKKNQTIRKIKKQKIEKVKKLKKSFLMIKIEEKFKKLEKYTFFHFQGEQAISWD